MARKPRVPKAPRIGGGGGRKRGPLSAETKMKIARSLARVKGDTSDWDPYEKKGRAPGKGDSGSSGGGGKKAARMTTTTSKGGAKVTSGIDKRTGNKVTVSKTSGTAGKNRKNAKATANPFGDFPNNTVKGGGHQASKEYLTPDNIREEPGFRSDLQAVADRLTTPAKAEKYLDRLDDRMARAMEDTGSPAKNRHNQRAAIHNYTQARELGLIDAELNRTGKKPVMPSKDKLPEVKAGDPEGNAKRAKGINAPVAGAKGKQAPKMKATAGKRKPATVKGEKAAEKPAKAAKPAKPTAKGAKGTKAAKNANTKPAKHPKVHGTYTPEEQAAERANPGRKGGIIDREAENLTPRQLNRLARYYGLDNEQKINQLGVDKGNKKFRHTPEFEKSYDKWLAKTVAPALDTLDPNGTIDRNDPDAVLGALGVGRKDGVDTRRALTSPIYFQTLSDDVRAAIAEHVGFVPSPVNMQRTNRGEKRPAVFAEAFAIQHRRQKAGELPRFAEDRKPVKRPKGKRKTPAPAKPKKADNTAKQAPAPKNKPKPNNATPEGKKAPAPAKPKPDVVTYRPADGDNMPAVGYHDGVTAKGTYITRPDGSQVRGDVKPVKVDTDPDRADRYDTAGRYAQITSDGKHLIVAKDESKLDDMLRDYDNSRGEVGKLVADNGEAPERDLGLSDWKNGNRDRTYVNKWHEPAGFEFETYKNSGRPKWATIDGKGISNTRADALRGGKVWVDNNTGELHVEAGGDELPADKIAERLIPELEKQLGHPVNYPPKGGKQPARDKLPELNDTRKFDAEEAARRAEFRERQANAQIISETMLTDAERDRITRDMGEYLTGLEGNTTDTANIDAAAAYLPGVPERLPEEQRDHLADIQKKVDKARAPQTVADRVTDNRDITERLLDVAAIRGRDDTLPMLTGVNFDVSNGNARVAATDRFRLHVEEMPIDAPDGKHLLDGKQFEAAMKAVRKETGGLTLKKNNDASYTLTRGNVSKNIDAVGYGSVEFPKTDGLMQPVNEDTPRFTVDAQTLRAVAREAAKTDADVHAGMRLTPVDGSNGTMYRAEWFDKYGEKHHVNIPTQAHGEPDVDVNKTAMYPAFSVNPRYLAGTIGGIKGDVTLANDAASRPVRVLTDGYGNPPKRLLMPIRELGNRFATERIRKNREQNNKLFDALNLPPENRVAFDAKQLRGLIKNTYEQVTADPDVKKTPHYYAYATPDGRLRIIAGDANSLKVRGEMPIEPGQREFMFDLKSVNNRGEASKLSTLTAPLKGDVGVIATLDGEVMTFRNRDGAGTLGGHFWHDDDTLKAVRRELRKKGVDLDGDNNAQALPGLNDVSKFDGDAAVKRVEKMELDRTRRELDEVGMTDAEKTQALERRRREAANAPRLDGQNGLRSSADAAEATGGTPGSVDAEKLANRVHTIRAEGKARGWITPAENEEMTSALKELEENAPTGVIAGRRVIGRTDGITVWGDGSIETPNGTFTPKTDQLIDVDGTGRTAITALDGTLLVYETPMRAYDGAHDYNRGRGVYAKLAEDNLPALDNAEKRRIDRELRAYQIGRMKEAHDPTPSEYLHVEDKPVTGEKAGKPTPKPDTQSSYTTAELKERGWKPKDIKALKEHKTTEKHRSATGVVDSFENNSRGQFTGYNLNRYDGDAVRDYEKGKDLGPHRVPTPPQVDGLELSNNKTRNGKTFFNVDNLADFTQNPEWFNVRLTPEGDVNIYEGKRLPPFPDGDDETWQWDTEKEALEKRLGDALNGNVRHVERKPVQKQTRPPLPEGETLDRRDNVVRFRKIDGEWAVEGEDLQVGDVVTVKKRGGKKSAVTITELVSDENGHQVARFKNGGGRRRATKRNTTGGAKLDGQDGLNATTPDKRAGTEITPGVVHGDNGAPRLAEGYNRFTGNPEKNHGRVPQTKEEIAAVQKWREMPLKNWAERRKAEHDLNAKGIDTRTDHQREVDAAVAAYNPTAAEKRPDSRGLYFNDLGAWQTTGYRAKQTQLARPGESSTEDRLITIGDREVFAPAGGTYGQKNGRIVLEGVDTRTGEKVKLKSDRFGQWDEPVTIRDRARRTFGRYSASATPQNMHAIQEAEERYPLSDRWNPKTHDDTETINKIKRTMAEDMIKSDPYMDKAPDISDDAARAWALEKIKGNEFRSDYNGQNQGQRARAHESLMSGEHKNMSIPRYTSPDSVHGPEGMYFTGETETPNIYRGLNRDPNEGRDKLTAALVDDPDARLVAHAPGEGLKFVRPVKVDEFRYGYRVTATDDEGKKHYVKIDLDSGFTSNAKIWRPLRHTDGTPYTRDEAAEYSSLKDELNKLPDVERVNWPEGRIWAQKREPEIEARLEALRGKTNPGGGNTTPAKPETPAKGGAGKRHKKGTPFTSENLKDGETLTESGAIRHGEYTITQAKTRDGKNGYAIVEQFGTYRMTRPTASKTLDKIRAEVDRMQAQRDKEQAAKSLEFPELQLMSSAQLETIASGTGAKATAAQQLLNDRG